MAKSLNHLIFVICFTVAGFSSAAAQQSDVAAQTAAIPNNLPIEEIVVTGQETLSALQVRIGEIEAEVFDFFNANNSSNRMNIDCYNRKPIGTNIPQKTCEPRFLTDLRVQKTRDARTGIGVAFVERDLVEWAAQDFEQLQQEMMALKSRNKSFSDSLDALAVLAAEYEARKSGFSEDD